MFSGLDKNTFQRTQEKPNTHTSMQPIKKTPPKSQILENTPRKKTHNDGKKLQRA